MGRRRSRVRASTGTRERARRSTRRRLPLTRVLVAAAAPGWNEAAKQHRTSYMYAKAASTWPKDARWAVNGRRERLVLVVGVLSGMVVSETETRRKREGPIEQVDYLAEGCRATSSASQVGTTCGPYAVAMWEVAE